MISICCTLPKPDYRDPSTEESKKFCRLVYLLKKRGYSIKDAQAVAYRKVLENGIPFDARGSNPSKVGFLPVGAINRSIYVTKVKGY